MAKCKCTPEIKAIIFDGLKQGMTDKQAFTSAGVGRNAFYRWIRTDEKFADLVKTAKEEYRSTLVAELESSLYRRATGFEYEEKETEYTSDNEGNPIIKKQIVKKKKVVPDTPALIFALCNLCPEKWKNRLSTQIDGKVKTESESQVSLAKVPDELLGQVLDELNKKE
jgi:hypothetical protein|nr:MAG TPA: terminase small subunit [Caudoviricetes sp.]